MSAELGSKEVSEMAGILLRLTVSLREIIVIAKVALRRGSSQHGNARLAAVGCCNQMDDLKAPLKTYLKLGQCIMFLDAILFESTVVVLEK